MSLKINMLGEHVDVYTKPEIDAEINKLKTFVTPQMYGAKGDGVTDDAAAIQNALDENPIVYLPPTDKGYAIGNTLYFRSNGQVLCGGNSVYNKDDSEFKTSRIRVMSHFGDNQSAIVFGSGVYGCTLKDVYIYGSRPTIATSGKKINGIRIYGNAESPSNLHNIENVTIYQFTGTGIIAGQNSWEHNLTNVTVRRCDDDGIVWESTDSKFSAVYVGSCGKNGIILGSKAGQGSNVLFGCKAFCNALHDSEGVGLLVKGGHNRIIGFDSQQNCSSGITIAGNYNDVRSCTIEANGWVASDFTDYVARDDDAKGLIVDGTGNSVNGTILNHWLGGSIETAICVSKNADGENQINMIIDDNIRSSVSVEYADRVDMDYVHRDFDNNENVVVINGKEENKVAEKEINISSNNSLLGLSIVSSFEHEIVTKTTVGQGSRNITILDNSPDIQPDKNIIVLCGECKMTKPSYVVTRLQVAFNDGRGAINIDATNVLSTVCSSKYRNVVSVFDLSDIANKENISQLRFLFRGQGTGKIDDDFAVRNVKYSMSEKRFE